MIRIKKIKGAALQLALLVATVVALLLSSFLLLTHTHSLFRAQSNQLFDVIESANSGVGYLFSSEEYAVDSIVLSNDLSQTIIKKEYWGAFQKMESTSSSGSKSFTKMALSAGDDIKNNLAVYVANANLPLVLAGKAKVDGNAFLPERGVKAGVISGNYFQGKTLINGQISLSNPTLPELDSRWVGYISALQQYIPSTEDEYLNRQQENKHSFFDPTQFYYTPERFFTSEKYTGHIILMSASEIIVGPHTQLNDILVVAPKITIQSGFKGNATFLASTQIVVESNVHLYYPSSIIVATTTSEAEKENFTIKDTPILIHENSTIEGVVYYLSDATLETNSNNRYRVHIKTESTTNIHGAVYCQGNMEHLGQVAGSIYTHKFIANADGSKYINHLYDGQISANNRNPNLASTLFKNTPRTTVKWLY